MKKSKLPPELVEKIHKALTGIALADAIENNLLDKHELSKEISQVAVDYSDEENTHMFNAVQILANKLQKIEKQRDELLQTLREASEYLPYIKKEDFKKLINRINGE